MKEKFRGSKTISFYIHKDSSSEYECVADNSIPPTVSKKIYLNIQCNFWQFIIVIYLNEISFKMFEIV